MSSPGETGLHGLHARDLVELSCLCKREFVCKLSTSYGILLAQYLLVTWHLCACVVQCKGASCMPQSCLPTQPVNEYAVLLQPHVTNVIHL